MRKTKTQNNTKILNLITLTVSICVSFLFVEVSLRIYDWYNRKTNPNFDWVPTFEFSQTRHHRLIPNISSRHKEIEFDYIWTNNSLGMRDIKRSIKKSPDTFRILFLGDSMIQGWGVPQEQSMVSVLENKLNHPKRKEKIEILNAGIFGYSPFLEYLYLKELLPLVKPDLVLEGFFLGNDVGDDYFYTNQAKLILPDSTFLFKNNDNWPWSNIDKIADDKIKEHHLKVLSGSGITMQYKSKFWNGAEPLLRKSRLINYIVKIFEQNNERQEQLERNKVTEEIVNENKDNIDINLGLINFSVLDKESRLKYWKISQRYLTGIFKLCKNNNTPAALIVIPSGEKNEFNEPYEVINKFANEVSVPVIYLKDEFLMNTEQTDYPIDGHWNSEGNRLAAGIINQGLNRLDLIPAQVGK